MSKRKIFHLITGILARRRLFISQSLSYHNVPDKLKINLDFVRYSTLELCFEEIKRQNVSGNIAELGVYKGDFAKRLNKIFHDRKLYLFDTFEGFNEIDTDIDQSNEYSSGNQDFSNTNINEVLKKMPYPENCIVKKGYFPESANGLEDRFCFVSIDADLYNPIKSGLSYFYKRLEIGGYIFVHDYNNDQYKGAKRAVLEFCDENKIGFVPVPDMGGSAIINRIPDN